MEIVADNGPNDAGSSRSVAIAHEPLAIGDQGSGAECWTVSLWASPCTSEGTEVCVEFGLTQASAIRQGARWVGNRLETSLSSNVVGDLSLEVRIIVLDEPINESLEGQSSISSPVIIVCDTCK